MNTCPTCGRTRSNRNRCSYCETARYKASNPKGYAAAQQRRNEKRREARKDNPGWGRGGVRGKKSERAEQPQLFDPGPKREAPRPVSWSERKRAILQARDPQTHRYNPQGRK